jgi:hypothetical protein
MRILPALAIVATVCSLPARASAQQKVMVLTEPDAETPQVAAKRLADQFYNRLQPIEHLVRDDQRLRRASEAIGLSAIALGALRGGGSLTFVGTQALRLGFDRQLTQIRNRTGLVVEPSIGYRSIGVTASRPLF